VQIFYDALTVDKRTILGDSLPKDLKATFELWQGQVNNRYKWNLDRIAKGCLCRIQARQQPPRDERSAGGSKTSDKRVIAHVLMYRTIMHQISIVDAACISHNKAAAKKLEQQASRSRQTKHLPANCRYDANKVCFFLQQQSLSFLFSLLGC
jgi:hypothetical protein